MSPRVLAVVLVLVACGGKVPETRYYQLAAPAAKPRAGELVIALEAFDTDAGYDDDRIVYRTTPYRLDYYQYHRWSASPGQLVGNFLEQALERSGEFRSVTRDVTERSPVVVRGRILAIEEVDVSKTQWVGRIVIELTLTDPKTGELLWSHQFEETEPLRKQVPEALAQALSIAMTRIAASATPSIAEYTRRHTEQTSQRP